MIDIQQFNMLTGGAHSLLAKHGYVLTYHPINGAAYLMTKKKRPANAWHAAQHLNFRSLIHAIHDIVGEAPPGQYHIPIASPASGPVFHLFDEKYEYGWFVKNQGFFDTEDRLKAEAYVQQELPGVPYHILYRYHYLSNGDRTNNGWVFVFKEKEHVSKLELARGLVVEE